MRYFFHFAYQGSNYRGWQRQTNTSQTIQEKLEDTLAEVLRRPVTIGGCGRTDAGVHASQYFFFCDLPEGCPPRTLNILNRRLPKDLSIFDIHPATEKAHPRYDAISRTYCYYLHAHKEVGLQAFSNWVDTTQLDWEAMQAAMAQLPNFRDFRAYCKVPDRHNSTLCNVASARMYGHPERTFFRFEFTADRFLRGMIRLLVGNLLAVGDGRQRPEVFIERLQSNQPPDLVRFAPPEGLHLTQVKYPYLDLPNKSNLHAMLNRLSPDLIG